MGEGRHFDSMRAKRVFERKGGTEKENIRALNEEGKNHPLLEGDVLKRRIPSKIKRTSDFPLIAPPPEGKKIVSREHPA